jgi:hypothetical protein
MPGTGADGKMCLRYHLLHESGERLTGEFPISGEGGIQMIGGRISYSRRYCLAALVGVAADEDDESRLDDGARGAAQRAARPRQAAPKTATAQAQRARTSQPPPLPGEETASPDGITKDQLTKLAILVKEHGLDQDRDDYLARLSAIAGREIKSSKALTKSEASRVIDDLDRNPGFGAQP